MSFLAAFGPITSVIEALAASAGAAVLLCGLAVATVGEVCGWSRERRDALAASAGCAAGVAMILLAPVEAIVY